ncbi:MAG: pilus assembly protein [Sneathiella sp.]|nr:pilus assembly protein [Sneathiella sp.]
MLAKLILLPTFRRFRKDKEGSTAVELALIFPVLALVLFGIMDLSFAMFVNTVVEGGLKDASRVGFTGRDTGGVSREQTIANIVNDSSLGMVDVQSGDISALVYDSFEDIGMPEPYTDENGDGAYTDGEPFTDVNGDGSWSNDMGEAGLGGPGEIVLYTLTYNWNLLSGQILPVLNGVIPMSATMVVRNEPF